MARKDPLTYDVIGAAMQVHQRLPTKRWYKADA